MLGATWTNFHTWHTEYHFGGFVKAPGTIHVMKTNTSMMWRCTWGMALRFPYWLPWRWFPSYFYRNQNEDQREFISNLRMFSDAVPKCKFRDTSLSSFIHRNDHRAIEELRKELWSYDEHWLMQMMPVQFCGAESFAATVHAPISPTGAYPKPATEIQPNWLAS